LSADRKSELKGPDHRPVPFLIPTYRALFATRMVEVTPNKALYSCFTCGRMGHKRFRLSSHCGEYDAVLARVASAGGHEYSCCSVSRRVAFRALSETNADAIEAPILEGPYVVGETREVGGRRTLRRF
jgi:hypothetical protein